ncbi:hypothetical protein HPG69_014052, partial [Diceros bicornis minor]
MGDSRSYFFHMEDALRKHSYLDKTLSLHVTALTRRPNILSSGPLESGRPGNLNCSVPWACEQGTPPIFSWTSVALTSLGPRTHLSSVLTLTPRPQDYGTNLTCRVTFPRAGVNTQRTIQLNVSYAPQNLTISVFRQEGTGRAQHLLSRGVWWTFLLPSEQSWGPEALGNNSSLTVQQGQSLRLVCVADSNPPARMSWTLASLPLTPSSPSTPGVLELPRVQLGHHGKYLIYPAASNPTSALKTLTNPCRVQSVLPSPFPGPSLPIPEVPGNATSLPVQEGQSLRLAWDPGVLELPRMVLRDGGEFTCRAQHPSASYHVSVNLVVQGFSCSCSHISVQQWGSWSLVLTLLRGALMEAGFLLTYSLTWIYYTRFRGSQEERAARCDRATSSRWCRGLGSRSLT